MNLKYIFFLISFSTLLNSINALIILPLYHNRKIINITSSYDIINNYMPNKLYTVIKVGNPPQSVEMIISEEDLVFSISKHNCLLKEYYFDKSKSNSFKNLTEQEKGISRFYESTEVEDTFYFYKNFKDKLIQVENLKFVFENEKENSYEDNINYNCAILSLNLFRYNIANNDYNFILELKKLGIIENPSWTIKYIDDSNNINNNNLDGYLIIGDYPHIYESDKYDSINLRSTLNNMNEKGWNI